jgi:DNA-binding NtrC family response regulator
MRDAVVGAPREGPATSSRDVPSPTTAVPGFCGMTGNSPVMLDLFETIRVVAGRDVSALITGPTGTGKELVARAIHALGDKSHGPFVPVNCSSLTNDLAESLLFGHVEGAFTGATQAHRGFIEEAEGGVLFLDEIGNMPFRLKRGCSAYWRTDG